LQQAGKKDSSAGGRYVRIELDRRGTLTLAEVQVFSNGRNVAPQGKAKQSSVSNDGEASRAIDGRTDGTYGSGTQTHTRENDRNPWWEVDLGTEHPIESIVVWNRTEGDLAMRLDNFTLSVQDAERREIFLKKGIAAPKPSTRIEVSGGDPLTGIRVAAIRAAVATPKEQTGTFAALAALVKKGENVVPAAQGVRTIPRTNWPKDDAASLASSLLVWARTIPPGARTGQDFVETIQTAADLAGFLPPDEATALRKELREMSVAVFVIKAVREQMRFDTPRIVVEAGKPFEIILQNDDFMQHNLVVVKPGGREKVGKITDAMKPDQLDDRGRAFVPKVPEIISATRLLDSGQKATLSFSGIFDEGTHEYVCTYPNHWAVMWGQLIVTKDVDAYLREHPQAALPAATNHDHGHGFE
jgi:azurin